MELPQVSVLVPAAVVVYTVSSVGVLLNLADNDACTDSVDSAGFDEEYVALMNGNFVQHFQQGVVLDLCPEFLFGNLTVNAEVQRSTLFTVQNVPHFGFAVFMFYPQCIFVAGVYLNGQGILASINLMSTGKFSKASPFLPIT